MEKDAEQNEPHAEADEHGGELERIGQLVSLPVAAPRPESRSRREARAGSRRPASAPAVKTIEPTSRKPPETARCARAPRRRRPRARRAP